MTSWPFNCLLDMVSFPTRLKTTISRGFDLGVKLYNPLSARTSIRSGRVGPLGSDRFDWELGRMPGGFDPKQRWLNPGGK